MKQWTRYIKGASGLFAEHACSNGNVTLLTRPPEDKWESRSQSTYLQIEGPILRGEIGTHKAADIVIVYPDEILSGSTRGDNEKLVGISGKVDTPMITAQRTRKNAATSTIEGTKELEAGLNAKVNTKSASKKSAKKPAEDIPKKAPKKPAEKPAKGMKTPGEVKAPGKKTLKTISKTISKTTSNATPKKTSKTTPKAIPKMVPATTTTAGPEASVTRTMKSKKKNPKSTVTSKTVSMNNVVDDFIRGSNQHGKLTHMTQIIRYTCFRPTLLAPTSQLTLADIASLRSQSFLLRNLCSIVAIEQEMSQASTMS
jgi:hypothetical protein